MKNTSWLLLAACGLPLTAAAQDADASRHHFGFGLPVWLKARANFTGTRATDPGPATGSTVNRFYDDGYNRVDNQNNRIDPPAPAQYSFPRTSYYGYQSYADQVRPDTNLADSEAVDPQGGTLSLHSFQLNGGAYTKGLENVPFPGLELFYRYDLKTTRQWTLGLETGVAYHFFQWEQHGPQNATVDLITDVFSLGQGDPGAASHQGGPDPTPGFPVIGSTPARQTQTAVPATISGSRALDMHAVQFRFGPTLDWTPNEQWSVGVQAGVALGMGFARLGFAETVTIEAPNIPAITQSGSSSDRHYWAGLFTALRLHRQISEHWSAHVDLRHMWTGTLHHNGPLRSGAIHLSDGLGVAAGVNYRF